MPDVTFWQRRFRQLGVHSVGPGDTKSEEELERHRQVFLHEIRPLLAQLKGPVLDFGCGVGRWVMDLPRPYLGLDLLPEHIEICKSKFSLLSDVDFRLSDDLNLLPDKSFNSIFTITVLQHIVEQDVRNEVLRQFQRVLSDDGVFVSVEWAEGQREYDWCTAVRQSDLRRRFRATNAGEVIEFGRRHTIWVCRKKKSIVL
jgi:SAM-dependent methyltransferase